MEDSIFTKIIKGELPCYKLYEDEQTLAFLDIHPIQPGHTLVIPKVQVDKFYELDDDVYQAVMATVKKVARHLETVLEQRVGMLVVGVDVPHAHIQLIPFSDAAQIYSHPDMTAEPDHDSLATMAKRLTLA
jgi:histidine triad (HIT) family protein